MKIKVVFIISGLNTGGAEMMLYKLLLGMSSNKNIKFEPIVISLSKPGRVTALIESLSIKVYNMNLHRFDLFSAFHVCKVIHHFKPDIIQGWMYHGNLMALLFGALFLYKMPVVWNIRHSLHNFKNRKCTTKFIIKFNAWLSKLPAVIINNSKTSILQHEHYLSFCPNKQLFIPNGFDVRRFFPSENARLSVRVALGLPENTFLIGLVGRYNPVKDIGNFLKAAAELNKTRPEIHFLLVGSGLDENNRELVNNIAKLNISERLHLLGEREDIHIITAALDIATSSSFSEGFPNSIGEAMSCEVPCVVTDVGDSALLVGETGRIVPPKDFIALYSAWEELINMGEHERKQLGIEARERIINHFSLDSISLQYEELYLKLFEKKNKVKLV